MSEAKNTPLAANLLRKAQRLSLAGGRALSLRRASGGPEQGKRRLTLLLTPAQNKRTSIQASSAGPPSNTHSSYVGAGNYGGYGSHSGAMFGSDAPSSAVATPAPLYPQPAVAAGGNKRVDPRPLRDKNYQNLILNEVYEFCMGNRFELESGHVLTPKTLRQPTQKDFVLIFQFLYGKLDPRHEFTRSVEAEVFPLLKGLAYPYLESINRLSISAVGGQHWPVFLGMLYWLVSVIIATPQLSEETLIAPEDLFDHIFIKYITSSYTAFREENEDYTPFYDSMVQEYDVAKAALASQLDATRREADTLAAKYREIDAQFRAVEDAREKSHALENDFRQFSAYMTKVKERQKQWDGILLQLEDDVAEARLKTEEIHSLCQRLGASIEAQGSSIAELDELEAERDRAFRAQAELLEKLEEAREKLASKEREIHQSLQSLQRFVEEYNAKAVNIPALLNGDESFEMKIRPNLMDDECLAFSSDEIFNKAVRDEKVKLLDIRADLRRDTKRVQGETEAVAEQADGWAEQIFEHRGRIQAETVERDRAKEQHDEIYDNMVSRKSEWSAKIETRTRKFQEMQIENNKGVIEHQTRNKELKELKTENKFHLQRTRDLYYNSVLGDVQSIVDFKFNIQDQLEQLEASTRAELEEELRKEAHHAEAHQPVTADNNNDADAGASASVGVGAEVDESGNPEVPQA